MKEQIKNRIFKLAQGFLKIWSEGDFEKELARIDVKCDPIFSDGVAYVHISCMTVYIGGKDACINILAGFNVLYDFNYEEFVGKYESELSYIQSHLSEIVELQKQEKRDWHESELMKLTAVEA